MTYFLHYYFLAAICLFRHSVLTAGGEPNASACGGWESFHEDKCFWLFDNLGLQTYEQAEQSCRTQDQTARLVHITTRQEQAWLADYLFTVKKAVDNVWIGAHRLADAYRWSGDNVDLAGGYSNWAEHRPRNQTGYCVQLNADLESVGKWADEPCTKRNLVLCERPQSLSLVQLQRMVLELRRNPVPVGFVYTQLSGVQTPAELWPWMTWTDVTANYEGVFFRAAGGDAAPMGQIQDDNCPRLISLETTHLAYEEKNSSVEVGKVNGPFGTGARGTHGYMGAAIKLEMSDGEVRPKNMAVRVWKRTA